LEKITKNNFIDLALMATYYEKDPSVWKLSLVAIDNENILTNSKRYTFELGENIPTKTASMQLSQLNKNSTLEDYLEAFSVEKLVPEFYKQLFEIFEKMLNTIAYPTDDFKQKQDFLVRLIGRLLFLKFLEKKGIIPKAKFQISKDYYHFTLEPLFFEILNTPINQRKEEFQTEEYNKIPYLNGGLFEAHYDDFYGFSYLSTLHISDELLEELLDLLNNYNFTIDENSPNDVEVSLDPEFLGNVFEQLIGYVNEENNVNLKKETGSYYTRKEIVEYMVNTSIFEYLKQNISEINLKKLIFEKIDNLEFEEKLEILKALHRLKILDPAVGSGAFPMGVLNKVVEILNIIDCDASMWLNLQKDEFKNKNQSKDPNYIRKLSIIQNSIFGVDIQPIAIEIAKLRFFLSLLVDEDSTHIEPLPNLEFNFACANSLIPLGSSPLASTKYYELEKRLKELKKDYFYAHSDKKQQIKDDFLQIQKEMINELAVSDVVQNKLINYNPFDNLSVAEFFDMEYMFNIKDGFDIVIGNPPYIDSENMTKHQQKIRDIIKEEYKLTKGNWDIYIAFFELGLRLLKENGNLVFITPDKWLSKPFGRALRACIKDNLKFILNGGRDIFKPSAKVDSIVVQITKNVNKEHIVEIYDYVAGGMILRHKVNLDVVKLDSDTRLDFLFSKHISFLTRIMQSNKFTLGDFWTCENACATSDAYKLKEILYNDCNINENKLKVVNTGTISKYIDLWGKREMTYLKNKYLCPVVEKDVFIANFGNTYVQRSLSKKIIIKGLTLLDGTIDFSGNIIPGKSTLVIKEQDDDRLKLLSSLINSKLYIFYLKEKYSGSSYNNGINFTPDMINSIPIPNISKDQQTSFIQKVDEIIQLKKQNKDTSKLEKELDELVYKLYGLSKEEIEIVEKEM
ncbi:MAG: hypothetical protein GXO40_00125, partial [Epsilonproteobacteria bacterium]|nr:hypothetical protein [Campylobacterota bacterium]